MGSADRGVVLNCGDTRLGAKHTKNPPLQTWIIKSKRIPNFKTQLDLLQGLCRRGMRRRKQVHDKADPRLTTTRTPRLFFFWFLAEE